MEKLMVDPPGPVFRRPTFLPSFQLNRVQEVNLTAQSEIQSGSLPQQDAVLNLSTEEITGRLSWLNRARYIRYGKSVLPVLP